MNGVIGDDTVLHALADGNPYMHMILHRAIRPGGALVRLHGDCLYRYFDEDQITTLVKLARNSNGRISLVPIGPDIYPAVIDTAKQYQLDGIAAGLACWQARVLSWPIITTSLNRQRKYETAGAASIVVPQDYNGSP